MMHLLLRYPAALVDEGFFAYAGREEGLFLKVDDLITYLVVTCYNKTFISTDQHVTHRKGLHATIIYFAGYGG